MGTTLVELLGIFLLLGVARLWLAGLARLWTISPTWVHHPARAAPRRRALPH